MILCKICTLYHFISFFLRKTLIWKAEATFKKYIGKEYPKKYTNSQGFHIKCVQKFFCKIPTKRPVPVSLFAKAVGLHLYWKENLVYDFSRIFSNSLFAEHIRATSLKVGSTAYLRKCLFCNHLLPMTEKIIF